MKHLSLIQKLILVLSFFLIVGINVVGLFLVIQDKSQPEPQISNTNSNSSSNSSVDRELFLEITPESGFVSENSNLSITGKTLPYARLVFGNKLLAANENGEFNFEYTLLGEKNTLRLTVINNDIQKVFSYEYYYSPVSLTGAM